MWVVPSMWQSTSPSGLMDNLIRAYSENTLNESIRGGRFLQTVNNYRYSSFMTRGSP